MSAKFSIIMEGSSDSLSILAPPMGSSPAVLLTPGRTRNIAQDMEALRMSRQDNPYLQQVMASRESLIESHHDECESDDTILMSQEFGSTALDFVEDDPMTLKEVHEHMIRSPPPINCWPHDTLSQRTTSAFEFDSRLAYSALSVDSHDKDPSRSPRRGRCEEPRNNNTPSRPRSSRSASPRSHDLSLCGRPLSLPGESHLRTALNKKCQSSERFSLLPHARPLRRAARRSDDSLRLVHDAD